MARKTSRYNDSVFLILDVINNQRMLYIKYIRQAMSMIFNLIHGFNRYKKVMLPTILYRYNIMLQENGKILYPFEWAKRNMEIQKSTIKIPLISFSIFIFIRVGGIYKEL